MINCSNFCCLSLWTPVVFIILQVSTSLLFLKALPESVDDYYWALNVVKLVDLSIGGDSVSQEEKVRIVFSFRLRVVCRLFAQLQLVSASFREPRTSLRCPDPHQGLHPWTSVPHITLHLPSQVSPPTPKFWLRA
jgi:hypothetical protein